MSGNQKLINGKSYNWKNIEVLIGGVPIEGIKSTVYIPGIGNKPKEPHWEYYYRRGNRFFFRNRYGYSKVVDVAPDETLKLKGILKKGMRIDITHSHGDEITKQINVDKQIIETTLNWPKNLPKL